MILGELNPNKEALQNATVVVRKPYAGLAEELTYTVFERVRAGLNLPSIFGASNAGKDQVTIWEKLNEYNKNNPNKAIDLRHVAHSLGASSTKNAMNWANYQGLSFDDTNAKLVALGTSYPIHSDLETGYFDAARGLFNRTRLDYSIAPKDCVGTCALIGRTPSTADNTNVGTMIKDLLPHHTAYIRDKEVLDFLYSRNKKKHDEIYMIQKETWGGRFEPKYRTLISKEEK